MTKLRWLLARFRDKNPDLCWGKLAIWVINKERFRDIFKAEYFEKYPDCTYCGKCDRQKQELK